MYLDSSSLIILIYKLYLQNEPLKRSLYFILEYSIMACAAHIFSHSRSADVLNNIVFFMKCVSPVAQYRQLLLESC
jgi:hypothetical protein